MLLQTNLTHTSTRNQPHMSLGHVILTKPTYRLDVCNIRHGACTSVLHKLELYTSYRHNCAYETWTHHNQWEHRCNIIITVVKPHHYYQATHQHLPTAWNSNAVETNWIKGIETMAQVVHARQSSSQSVTYDVSHQAFMCLSRSHTCNTHSPKSAHTYNANASRWIAGMLVFSSKHMYSVLSKSRPQRCTMLQITLTLSKSRSSSQLVKMSLHLCFLFIFMISNHKNHLDQIQNSFITTIAVHVFTSCFMLYKQN